MASSMADRMAKMREHAMRNAAKKPTPGMVTTTSQASFGAAQPSGSFGGPQPSGTFGGPQPSGSFGGPQQSTPPVTPVTPPTNVPSGGGGGVSSFRGFSEGPSVSGGGGGGGGPFIPAPQPAQKGQWQRPTSVSPPPSQAGKMPPGPLYQYPPGSPALVGVPPSSGASAGMVPQFSPTERDEPDDGNKMRAQLEAMGAAGFVSPKSQSRQALGPGGKKEKEGPEGDDSPPQVARVDVTDRHAILSLPPPKTGMVQCYVVRDKSGIRNFMNPRYMLFSQRGDRFLLAARKRANKKTANYLISLDKDDLERQSGNYYGKVRSNFGGTGFMIFDKGERSGREGQNGVVRQELGGIFYETNIGGMKGPRKMVVVVPEVRDDGTHDTWRPASDEESMIEAYKKGNKDNLIVLRNKSPSWNESVRAYVLNFHGRVTMASVKNFQLADETMPNRVVMQFGKVDSDRFTMDYQYPLTCMQAFGIALTALDSKLACE